MAVSRQLKEYYRSFSQHGAGEAKVEIEPREVVLLIHISYMDIYEDEPEWLIPEFISLARENFYNITPKMVYGLPVLGLDEAVELLQKSGASNPENVIYLYLKNLAELYRRRLKFYNILKTQPFPTAEQIGPRCLLEYGRCADELLFSWMNWRKFIYDVDNRSAQETGYLFEPILASCLGGVPVSHRVSPVKRVDVDGNITNDGRQVDCYIEESKEVYELKLRVTIAASGQGRFKEEMSFPHEAHMAGLTPILVVFDPTPSILLERLKKRYVEEGGRFAIGEDAWSFLSDKAGKEMGKYILKYIKPPLSKMDEEYRNTSSTIFLSSSNDRLVISDSRENRYEIMRSCVAE